METCACKGCTARFVGCHSQCEKYAAFLAKRQADRENAGIGFPLPVNSVNTSNPCTNGSNEEKGEANEDENQSVESMERRLVSAGDQAPRMRGRASGNPSKRAGA